MLMWIIILLKNLTLIVDYHLQFLGSEYVGHISTYIPITLFSKENNFHEGHL
jgi:hypothetical protein